MDIVVYISNIFRRIPAQKTGQTAAKLARKLPALVGEYTMGQNRKKHGINIPLVIHCPTSKGMSKVSDRANE